jgi:hypothetical protein
VSRQAMLEGLRSVPRARNCLPFVRMFYGEPSEYVWYDDGGTPHIITQAEGGEQGDPLMPALFAMGQHPALMATRANLGPNEHLLAFLDDIYVICEPDRAAPIFEDLSNNLLLHCGISVHQGKTKIWNRGGVTPYGLEYLGTREDPAWRGDHALPAEMQGMTVLGVPVGSPEFIQEQLRIVQQKHTDLLDKIVQMDDLQSAWLLLSMCANARCNYYLRSLMPSEVEAFARHHDEAIATAFWQLMDNPAATQQQQDHRSLFSSCQRE